MLSKIILRLSASLIIISTLSLPVITTDLASAAGNAIVSVSAPADGINAGEQFTVNITVEPNNAMAGMQFNLSYDPNVITVNSITEGNLLKQGGADTYFNSGHINNAAGTVTGVFGAIISPGQSVATAGSFAVITMTAGSSEGVSPLTLSNVVIGDIDSHSIPVSIIDNTINITAAVPGLPLGGGGNMGGGSSDKAGVTNLRGLVDSNGLMLEELITTDTDYEIELRITQGTYVRNKYGQALTSLTITPQAESQSSGPGSVMVSRAYEIEPEGATFDESATLVFKYDVADMAAGVSEKNLYIALWDPVTMAWTDLGGTLDSNSGTVSVPINHLSIYTLMAYNRPANMSVANFNLTPGEVAPGEAVTASIEVKNQGDLAGTYQVELTLDGSVIQTRAVTVEGGSSEEVVFTIILNTFGKHQISLGGFTATFLVLEPQTAAAFIINQLEINPALVDQGGKVNVSILIVNTGDLAGTYPITLSVDDIIIENREINLDGHGSITASFSFMPDITGEHVVSIGGLQGRFEVRQSSQPTETEIAGLELNSFSTTPNYDAVTNTLVSVRINIQMNQPWLPESNARLVMTVFYNGEQLEEVPLFSLGHFTEDGTAGEYNYIPNAGWMSGEYTFQAELYDGDNLVQDTFSHRLVVTPEAITKVVSWWTLGAVIGIATLLIIVLTSIIVYRRRDMLRS